MRCTREDVAVFPRQRLGMRVMRHLLPVGNVGQRLIQISRTGTNPWKNQAGPRPGFFFADPACHEYSQGDLSQGSQRQCDGRFGSRLMETSPNRTLVRYEFADRLRCILKILGGRFDTDFPPDSVE